jgi:hypothetical protein
MNQVIEKVWLDIDNRLYLSNPAVESENLSNGVYRLEMDPFERLYLSRVFESFTFDEMSYDPIEIVAPHWLVKEKPNMWMKLPIILSTDIIARYYLFKPGDVVAIKEGNFTTYRKCVQVS